MRFVLFYHSLISDWNHGNAHFLRGVATELLHAGHTVSVLEPANGWSARRLREECGPEAIAAFHASYPQLRSRPYDPATLDLDEALDAADVVIVHEWNEPELVARIGRHRAATRSYRLLFHDTHHRAASAPQDLCACDLSHFDGVLAFGECLRQIYLDRCWTARAWTWHEAADTRVFTPPAGEGTKARDLVWIGNWGDGERAAELLEFIVEPVRALGLRARFHGVRYPPAALETLQRAGIDYAGWIPNFQVPGAFAAARFTVHVPRRFYSRQLRGIPTIRMFEALACGIPLISAPWEDCEGLFAPGSDFLVARDGNEARRLMRLLAEDRELGQAVADSGRRRIRQRHTCAHRVQELLAICAELGAGTAAATPRSSVAA